jgi:hypothetical protein
MYKKMGGWYTGKGDVLLDILDFVGQALALAVTRGSNRLSGASGMNRAGRSKQEVGAEKLETDQPPACYMPAGGAHSISSSS